MKFFLDENMPYGALGLFHEFGLSAEHVRDAGLLGAADEDIAAYAKKKNSVLVTKDLQFGNILVYPPGSHYGLLIIRFPFNYSGRQIVNALKEFLKSVDIKSLENSIAVVEIGRYRIRKLKD